MGHRIIINQFSQFKKENNGDQEGYNRNYTTGQLWGAYNFIKNTDEDGKERRMPQERFSPDGITLTRDHVLSGKGIKATVGSYKIIVPV
jgi:hypothetical protein